MTHREISGWPIWITRELTHAELHAQFMPLIMSRTADDVVTENKRGQYNLSDLNRVEYMGNVISELLERFGYQLKQARRMPDWKESDQPTNSDRRNYFARVGDLGRQGKVLLPPLPTAEDPFDYEAANNLEKRLCIAAWLLMQSRKNIYYSGELFSGEV